MKLGGEWINSDDATPFVTSGGTASQLNAVTGADAIARMEILGDHIVFLAARSINMVEFVGDPIGHTIRTVLQGIGPFSRELVVNHGDYIEFLSHDRAYRFDGVGKSEVGSQVFRELLRTTDAGRAWQSHGYRDTEEGEVQWLVAITSDVSLYPETAYAVHYIEPVGSKDPTPITRRDMPSLAMTSFIQTGKLRWDDFVPTGATMQFDVQTIRWDDRSLQDDAPIVVFGDKDGKFWQLNVGVKAGAANLECSATMGRRPCWDSKTKGRVRTIEPYIAKQAGFAVDVTVGALFYDRAADTDVSTAKSGMYSLDGTSARRVPIGKGGRWYQPTFIISSADHTVEIAGWDVELVPIGAR